MEQNRPTYTSPIDNIRNSYPLLSPVQKKIADLILEQAETICFMRLEDISKLVGVTSAFSARCCFCKFYPCFDVAAVQNFEVVFIRLRNVF